MQNADENCRKRPRIFALPPPLSFAEVAGSYPIKIIVKKHPTPINISIKRNGGYEIQYKDGSSIQRISTPSEDFNAIQRISTPSEDFNAIITLADMKNKKK